LFFISDQLPIGVSTFLFLLILAINLVFWVTWIKMVFSTTYTKVKNFFMKKFCPGRYKQKKDIGMLENPIADLDDDKKQQQPDNTFREDDSSRHGLAVNESNR
jgi:hypothetical protein